jgi:hypothetical protein
MFVCVCVSLRPINIGSSLSSIASLLPAMLPLTITIKENLQLQNVPPQLMEMLIEKLQFLNPKWLENERMGRWNRGTPKMLKFYDKVGSNGLWIPRGYIRHLINLCRRRDIEFRLDDQRRRFKPVNFTFKGRLKPFQEVAVADMLAKDFGTLSSATGSGKTVMALYIIAQRRQPALIIVHTKELASQWIERIETFLEIEPESVGFIGGGKKIIGEKITNPCINVPTRSLKISVFCWLTSVTDVQAARLPKRFLILILNTCWDFPPHRIGGINFPN